MDNKKLLGKRIKELRKNAGLTQEKLAEMINIETTLPTIEKIANNLNVELKSLFDFNHLKPIDLMKIDIINNLDSLSHDKIIFIHKFFE